MTRHLIVEGFARDSDDEALLNFTGWIWFRSVCSAVYLIADTFQSNLVGLVGQGTRYCILEWIAPSCGHVQKRFMCRLTPKVFYFIPTFHLVFTDNCINVVLTFDAFLYNRNQIYGHMYVLVPTAPKPIDKPTRGGESSPNTSSSITCSLVDLIYF